MRARHYDYFIDELYYLACARYLAAGYVDQPPLIAFTTRLGMVLWGGFPGGDSFSAGRGGCGQGDPDRADRPRIGWGPICPGACALSFFIQETVIVMQGRQQELEKIYASVELRAHVSHPYSMP